MISPATRGDSTWRSRGPASNPRPLVTERASPERTLFHYASSETTMIAAVPRGASGESLSAYLTPRLWQAVGAETSALWHADRTGLEVAYGNFSATLRDYARLGTVLAYDGAAGRSPAADHG
jgi:CubicO group peptidase (beta-lactamase class C family)